MAARNQRFEVEDITRDLDMVVYRLEHQPESPTDPERERRSLRRELEQLRDRLNQVARNLE